MTDGSLLFDVSVCLVECDIDFDEPREVNLVGKARSKEAKMRNLQGKAFSNMKTAMGVEWSKWLQFGAAKPLSDYDVRMLQKQLDNKFQIVSCR